MQLQKTAHEYMPSVTHTIRFEPLGRQCQSTPRESLLECARGTIGVSCVCGGHGTCRSCRVVVLEGEVSPPTANEQAVFSPGELASGWRLACQAYPLGPCRVSVPASSLTGSQRTQVETAETAVEPDPIVRLFPVKLGPPTLMDPSSDETRVLAALETQHGITCSRVDPRVLADLPTRLREYGWRCGVIVSGGEIIRVAPEAAPLLGLAVDLGTTKIAGYLVDLISGRTLAAAGTMNPQISFGDDIVSRMGWSMKSDEGRGRLKQIVVDALSDLSRDLCERAGASIDDVVDMVIVGNTAEHHLMLGLAVHALARAPYVPVVQQALDMKAAEVGVRIASGANVHVLPNISGYVGADHVAALLSTSLAESKGVAMLLDIGTNTEISLAVDGKVESVSCASGPVFEGGHIECGMRAGSGAIERVHIRGGKVRVQTIDGAPATGICGSGILDAIAQLLRAGLIDQNGRMAATASSGVGVPPRFLLWEGEPGSGRAPVYVSQRDVREVQLGKAAIRSGIQVLLESRKAHEEEIEKILIAGAFGSYLDVDSAIDIGLLPAVPRDRVSQIGNAAGMGAKLALISRGLRDKAKRIASEVGYVELGAAPSFFSIFVEASCLGKFRLVNGKRIEIN